MPQADRFDDHVRRWRRRAYSLARYSSRCAEFVALLGGKCAKCGAVSDLEFDHIDPSSKSFKVTTLTTLSRERMLDEAMKCQLLCWPCHNDKTLREQGRKHAEHGTASMYYGLKACRCQPCREAARAYRKTLAIRTPLEHATHSMYLAGCRCFACTEYQNWYQRTKQRAARIAKAECDAP